jgi:hypothetical protein
VVVFHTRWAFRARMSGPWVCCAVGWVVMLSPIEERVSSSRREETDG